MSFSLQSWQNMTKDESTYSELLNEVFAAHANLQGVPAARAELQYIKDVQLMDGYGCDFYVAKVCIVLFLLAWKMWVCVVISVRPAGHMSVHGKNLNVAIFSDILKIINVKLCMVVVLIEHYPFIPLSVTLIVFQGHSSVKQL